MTIVVPAGHTEAAQKFWDENSAVVESPLFWMANPLCRAAINRLVSGDPNRWPLDEFARLIGNVPGRKGLSLGCGLGSIERWAIQKGICAEMTGIDLSPATLALARERAEAEGIEGITYRLADMNDLTLPKREYDVVFIHQSLHHVVTVERLMSRVARALKPDGVLFLDEWTGPSINEWNLPINRRRLARTAELFNALPDDWKRHPELFAPISGEDPSEGIRSSAILPAVRLFFDAAERPYGGHIVALVMNELNETAARDPRLPALIAKWLEMESSDIASNPELSYHTAIAGRPYRGARLLAGQFRALPERLSLNLRSGTRHLRRNARRRLPHRVTAAWDRLRLELPVRAADFKADLRERVRRSDGPPVPPAWLRAHIGRTSSRDEYLTAGRGALEELVSAFMANRDPKRSYPRWLDFGCGCARLCRYLPIAGVCDSFVGLDVDAQAIRWNSRHLPTGEFLRIDPVPPTTLRAASFDVIYAASVFTHFDEPRQFAWLKELARLLRPGGLLFTSTHPDSQAAERPDLSGPQLERLQSEGFAFAPGSGRFNDDTAFHSQNYLEEHWGKFFSLVQFRRKGLFSLHDLSVWTKL